MSELAPSEMAAAIRPVISAFDALGVRYLIGGSVASGVHGEARGTRDVDLVAEIWLEHVKPFVAALVEDFYVDEETVRMAVAERSSFNLIHSGRSENQGLLGTGQNARATHRPEALCHIYPRCGWARKSA